MAHLEHAGRHRPGQGVRQLLPGDGGLELTVHPRLEVEALEVPVGRRVLVSEVVELLAGAQVPRVAVAGPGAVEIEQAVVGGTVAAIGAPATTEAVARALHAHTGLRVITNNLNVVGILSGTPRKEIILAGGLVRQSDGAIVGDEAVGFIRGFKADFAFIGASALDEDGAILDYDMREVAVARAIIANARRAILVSDSQKFDRSAPVRICGVGDLHAFVTDAAPPRDHPDPIPDPTPKPFLSQDMTKEERIEAIRARMIKSLPRLRQEGVIESLYLREGCLRHRQHDERTR